MNKARRHLAKKRRHWARVKHEMQVWSLCDYTAIPKGGRLRRPALAIDVMLRAGFASLERAMAPILAIAGRREERKGASC